MRTPFFILHISPHTHNKHINSHLSKKRNLIVTHHNLKIPGTETKKELPAFMQRCLFTRLVYKKSEGAFPC